MATHATSSAVITVHLPTYGEATLGSKYDPCDVDGSQAEKLRSKVEEDAVDEVECVGFETRVLDDDEDLELAVSPAPAPASVDNADPSAALAPPSSPMGVPQSSDHIRVTTKPVRRIEEDLRRCRFRACPAPCALVGWNGHCSR